MRCSKAKVLSTQNKPEATSQDDRAGQEEVWAGRSKWLTFKSSVRDILNYWKLNKFYQTRNSYFYNLVRIGRQIQGRKKIGTTIPLVLRKVWAK